MKLKRKRSTSSNPEVQQAMDVRDDLMDKVGEAAGKAATAIAEVDRLNEMLREYEQAEKQREHQ